MIQRTRIKFCGFTRVEDVALAVALGVDAVGIILAERSKRRVSLAHAQQLRAALPPLVASVALVMDQPVAQVREIASILRPTLIQFHGSETEADCRAAGIPYLKAIAMGEDAADAEAAMAGYPSAGGFVLDGHLPGEAGGGGETFDWSRWPRMQSRPILLAGGLNPSNVYAAVRMLRPFAVDVASGIESAPGEKNGERMAHFIAEVRRADSDNAETKFNTSTR
ncbi:MAG: phosphoribosylanthranilate isomerase [Pseudomarimonas sp.]